MPVYNAKSIPAEVHSSTKDPEVAAFLKTGPVLGAHKPIHEHRVEHNAFIDKVKPPIGKIEHLVLDGPHGSLPVRVYYPSKPGPAEGGALIYVHGGGFIVGTLDQFDTAMRLFSDISGAQVYSVDYKLAPEYQWPTQIEEVEFAVRWLFKHASKRGLDPNASDWAETRPAATSPARSVSSCETRTVRSWRCRCRSTLKPRCRFSPARASKMFPAAMSIRQASCSLYGASCRRASITRSRTSRR